MTAATIGGITWDRFPTRNDPRLPFVAILITYVILGVTVLGFNRSLGQIAVIVGTTCALDTIFSIIFRRKVLFPLSSAITGFGLSILVNTAHGIWFPMIPAFFAVASKYLITVNGRHIFNPNLFGLLTAVTIGGGMISPAPAYQWGGYTAFSAFVVTAALILFVFRINRNPLIISFLGFYTLTLFIRGYITQHHVPPETIIMGTITSPAFYLFTFFMITDPATSPRSTKGQIFMAFFISFFDLALHKFESLSTLFKAGFVFYCLMYFYRWYEFKKHNPQHSFMDSFKGYLPRLAGIPLVGLMGVALYNIGHTYSPVADPGFKFTKIEAESLGILSEPGDTLTQVDPRVQHLSKWILAQGDGVAVADVDNDGDQDFFISYPLKTQEARVALYINNGGFSFERFPLPALNDYVKNFRENGLPSGGLWFDYDNDGDKDLYVVTGFGYGRLLQNTLSESGTLGFVDVTGEANVLAYTNSMSATAADLNQDGLLDLLVANSLQVKFPDYEDTRYFNIFDLPEPEYEGDRRGVHFMHRTWHNADNGGENIIFLNNGQGFVAQDNEAWGYTGTRWTLDHAVGDLNKDGWPDIYLANDFGPDQLFISEEGRRFKQLKGRFVGEMGRDTYKGMNATMADFNSDGLLDVYVSNVHVALQAEGSMLWINKGTLDTEGPYGMEDRAMALNALNENRFGWGAAAADIDRDGRLDILQANGMVNDNYDELYEGCPDYWYWNDKIALTGPEVHSYADRYADLRGRCIYPHDKKRVYLNTGDYFVDAADQVGWSDTEVARGIATVDLDNDGDLDVLVSQPFAPLGIYRNDSKDKQWAGVKLVGNGTTCNRDAVGTKATLVYEDSTDLPMQYREVMASNGLVAQSDQRLLFGLDQYPGHVSLQVDWCGQGKVETYQLSKNQYSLINQ
ncbi:MAG: FG-GAP-like repeat-containing protein [Ketobacteraceae bacterium]|nr:FG-GAP-like repeat-containing protein [Ketobacteraceae bacterium]